MKSLKRNPWLVSLAVLPVFAIALAFAVARAGAEPAGPADWSFNASVIEACSCPMFCQCFFNTAPAGHHEHGGAHGESHFCRFNNAYRINKGSYKGASLEGVKFWVAGDLGGDFSQGKTDWAVLTFDPSVGKAQRDGVAEILGHVYPVHWGSFQIAPDQAVEWQPSKDGAVARLGGGKAAEVVLKRFAGMDPTEPVVIRNLRYFAVPRNGGFTLMPNEVEAYRLGDKAFEFKGTNGFMVTLDINSKDVAKAAGM